jgi:hypothetical protein
LTDEQYVRSAVRAIYGGSGRPVQADVSYRTLGTR